MILKYSEIIQQQASINIGIIGHVAHGKSTLTKSLTGTKTQKFTSEQERNITIHIGYANTKIFVDNNGNLHTAKSNVKNLKDFNGNDMKLIKHVSFVDCPGHEAFMSNMISGSAIMDSCVLVIASNDSIPQPQTYEHLQAVENTGINDFLILQNKLDLIKENDNSRVYNDINNFLQGTKAENANIIPSSIQNNINKDEILKTIVNLPEYTRKINEPAQMIIIRSFDINKSNISHENLLGGVVGGSLISGMLKKNDIVELRPGFIIKNGDEFKFKPIVSTIQSLKSDISEMEYALPGGLVGICLDIDPSLTKSNGMIGQMIGLIGTLPNVYSAIKLEYEKLKRYDNIDDSFKLNETVQISVNSMNIKGQILSLKQKKNYFKIKLEKPICVQSNKKIAIFKNVNNRWLLVAKSIMTDGKLCEIESDNIYKTLSEENKFNRNDIEIEYDVSIDKYVNKSYEEMLKNVKFKSDNIFKIKIVPPIVKIINKETIFSNFSEVSESIKLREKNDINMNNLIHTFIENELSCSTQLSNNSLILKGKFKKNSFQVIISKFIQIYLKCFSCKSLNCYLIKENRKYFRICLDCESKSCVEA